MKKLAAAVLLAATSTLSFAQTLVLKADRLIDVENGKLISNAVVVIEDDTIVAAAGTDIRRAGAYCVVVRPSGM